MREFLLLLMVSVALAPRAYASSDYSIGVSVADLTNPYFVKMIKSIKSEVAELPNKSIDVIVRSSAYDLDRQIQQIESFIDKKVDLIMLVASDELAIAPAVIRAQRAGIRVIAVDVRASGADVTITTDNIQAGEISCLNLVNKLNEKGKVLIINGPPVSASLDRVAGCKSVLNDYPDIELLDANLNGTGSYDGGLEAMAYALHAYEKIDGVFAINDPTALGAEQALLQSGAHVWITSVDGAPLVIEALKENRQNWLGTAAQFPAQMSSKAVQIGLELIGGGKVEKELVLIQPEFINASNYRAFSGW
ncbi:substrate-binding domain-containing protein [Vibrio penaeicida]|uniref:Autoinducer 2-binding periplasmic protein LuxP n=1 Tax=Vibrio penaeicida TaxID=104609 RepID=A0AAV5NY68_9VIBR|nr:substrate-binding domain-containing protein [Vibrio penaeicida]RTZ21279.1 ABC transporter substrate-binding protein [Vibrio penaeicida]GLQ75517.1 ribose ABC superfamily ATP-binding protein [Vibrio penaeicida]